MRRIPLTQGQFTKVDNEDYLELSKHKWYAHKMRYGGFTVVRTIGKQPERKTIFMHRQIMSCPQGLQIDHINHNTLDNRQSNLRICTNSQNQMNGKSHRGSTSEYKGCCWNKLYKKWQAQIQLNNKQIHLGLFIAEIEAAKAYNNKAKELFGEFANPNQAAVR